MPTPNHLVSSHITLYPSLAPHSSNLLIYQTPPYMVLVPLSNLIRHYSLHLIISFSPSYHLLPHYPLILLSLITSPYPYSLHLYDPLMPYSHLLINLIYHSTSLYHSHIYTSHPLIPYSSPLYHLIIILTPIPLISPYLNHNPYLYPIITIIYYHHLLISHSSSLLITHYIYANSRCFSSCLVMYSSNLNPHYHCYPPNNQNNPVTSHLLHSNSYPIYPLLYESYSFYLEMDHLASYLIYIYIL